VPPVTPVDEAIERVTYDRQSPSGIHSIFFVCCCTDRKAISPTAGSVPTLASPPCRRSSTCPLSFSSAVLKVDDAFGAPKSMASPFSLFPLVAQHCVLRS
jgi:hypothetical protein